MASRYTLLVALLLVAVCVSEGSKIHPNIYRHYASRARTETMSAMLLLHEEADVESAVRGVPFEERGQVVFDVLTRAAAASQPAVTKMLDEMNVEYRPYWLVNMIVVETDLQALEKISQHPNIREIHPNFEHRIDLPNPDFYDDVDISSKSKTVVPDVIEWNIQRVNAPAAWAKGIDGSNFTVAIADTGVQWDHPALIEQYRGYTSATQVNHNYNWWDSVHKTTTSRCAANSKAPCDDQGHGTHCTGTAAGTDHKENQIGVAPGAKWIACRNMNAGLGQPATYIECLQFFVAPTDLNGANPDPSKRPHVIGNSYGCPASEGCVADSLQTAVTNVISAGIFMSVSAGNDGPACSTVNAPPGTYTNVFSVGALAKESAEIASYSSRGPVNVNGVSVIKPDISAPGSQVRSSYPTNTYRALSGTSMASPHITGIISLVWQARPDLIRDIDATRKLLALTAHARATNATCGGGSLPNNVYGYGEVNLLGAIAK